MTLEQQVHKQEVEIRKLKEELQIQKSNMKKLVEFFNDTRLQLSEDHRLKLYGRQNG